MAGTATPAQAPRARLPPSNRAAERLAASDLQSHAASPMSRHDDAVGRLEAAIAERDRQRHRYEAQVAFETSLERSAYTWLCEANERVATRARWLEWIDQHCLSGSTSTGIEGYR